MQNSNFELNQFGYRTGLTMRQVKIIIPKVLIGKPVLDIQSAEINGSRYLAALGETDLTMYKWE